MPDQRFEDLMDGQGRIRLRTNTFANDLLHQQMSFCRGWCLRRCNIARDAFGRWDVDLLFEFAPDKRDIIVLTETSATPIQKWPEADFDAMLAALEPYELVTEADEPLTVAAPSQPQ